MLMTRSSHLLRSESIRSRCLWIVCDNSLNRMFSSHVARRLTNCLSSQPRQLFNCTIKHQVINCNILWSSRASISSSSSSGSSFTSTDSNLELNPLNLTQIADELSKLANADKTGSAPTVAQDSVTITDVDLTEFTAPIDLNTIPECLLTASDVGLTWFAPTNVVFKSLMAIHEQLPWWASIAALTVCLRIFLFPLMIRNMKATAKMSKNVKELEVHRTKFRQTMDGDNQALQVKAAIELLDVMKRNQLSVLKSMSPMVAMGIVFSSNFFAIRAMANYPLASMKTEGLYWFSDLTIPDPYFVLPTLTACSLYFVMASGNETAAVDPVSAKALQFLPMVLCPIIVIVGSSFPAALNTYWLTNNLISLGQGVLLRRTRLRDILDIPDPVKASKEMGKGSLQSTLDMQKDIQLAADIVQKLYASKMTTDIKIKTQELKKDKTN